MNVLRESQAGQIVTFGKASCRRHRNWLPRWCASLKVLNILAEIRWNVFELYSARNSSRTLANAVEQAVEFSRRGVDERAFGLTKKINVCGVIFSRL